MIDQQKIQEWIKNYLSHVNEITLEVHVQEEEGYKFKAVDNFQNNFDIDAPNLKEMLDRSLATNNMVVGSHYFPKGMLMIFAADYEMETREALRQLFDESQPVKDRIDNVESIFSKLMELNNSKNNKNDHNFIGLRFLSLLLAYRYPNTHNALKPREWRNYCRYMDEAFMIPKGSSSGAQYEIYKPYIESLRETIKVDSEINNIRIALTKELNFKDDEFRWMTQDIIYVTSKVIDNDYDREESPAEVRSVGEGVESVDEENEPVTVGDRFFREEDLQYFITDNFENINFGSDLQIYTDAMGRQGLFYKTEIGEIDILATDKDGNYVVIELKRSHASDSAVGQLSRYMQWVEVNLAQKENKSVRGIIVTHKCKSSIMSSVNGLRFPVSVLQYKLKMDLTAFDG